nr:unnamed protein product [Digitaria exilis]
MQEPEELTFKDLREITNGFSVKVGEGGFGTVYKVRKNWRKRWQAICSSDFSVEACCRQVETCTQIALDCLEKDGQKRPCIVKMIEELNKIEPGLIKVIDTIANFYIKKVCFLQ